MTQQGGSRAAGPLVDGLKLAEHRASVEVSSTRGVKVVCRGRNNRSCEVALWQMDMPTIKGQALSLSLEAATFQAGLDVGREFERHVQRCDDYQTRHPGPLPQLGFAHDD